MEKKSPASNSDILERLRQNVENQDEQDTEPLEIGKNSAETPDQILKKLKAQLGETGDKCETTHESDYDISGFEIEAIEELEESQESNEIESVETVNVAETAALTQENAESNKASAPEIEMSEEASAEIAEEANAQNVEAVPADIDETEAADVNSEPITKKSSDETLVKETLVTDDETDPTEVEEAETESDEEGIRQRVALFVEKTVNPEEDFDYFAEMDRIAAKRKDTSVANEEAETEDAVLLQKDSNTQENTEAEIREQQPLAQAAEDVSSSEMEEEPSNEPEYTEDPKEDLSETPCVDHSPNPFFFSSRVTAENQTEKSVPSDTDRDAERLDDTDINLLLALGKKEAVENSIGFVRVREAKNNFYDPLDEEPISHTVFAYDGQEFRAPEQAEAIKTRYRKEKKSLYKRMICTLILAVFVLFVEHVVLLKIQIPFVSDFLAAALPYYLVNYLLTVGGLLLSAKTVLQGLRGFFTMRPNQHTPLAMLSVMAVIYDVLLVAIFRESGLPTYNSALLIFLSLSIIGDAIRLTKEMLTFDVISDEKEKFSLEKSDTSPELFHEKKMLYKRDLLVERVSFVGKYFNRTARRPASFNGYFIELLIVQVLAIFAGILAAFISKNLADSVHMYTLVLFVCIPMQYLIYDIYSLQKLSKILYRHDSAIIGENADREYVGANTVYLDDIEMFGHRGVSVSGLRIYDEKNFYHVLYLAQAVFSKIEGPLRYVLENKANETQKAKEVTLENICANGIEATVDSEHKVLIGNVAFMRNNGFFPKRNEDDEKKVECGELCILHMAVNGELCAKFYMKYTVTQRFEKFVAEMKENGTKVGIRTLDPNVTERMIALLRGDEESEISVIRPTLNDLVPLGRRSDSSIITAKSPHMISQILARCAHLKKVRRTGMWLRLASALIGLSTIITLFLIFSTAKIPSLFVALYQLLWLIPAIIYIKIKLK